MKHKEITENSDPLLFYKDHQLFFFILIYKLNNFYFLIFN